MWGALGKVGSYLGKLSMGLSSPHHCPPSVIGSTKKERRCGPGVTHSWRAGQQIHPALRYLPSPASTGPHPQATFLQMTEAHSGMGIWGSAGDRKAGPGGGWATPSGSPFPSSQAKPAVSKQPQQLHFSSRALPKPQPVEEREGPSSTASPLCFPSKGHRHPLYLIKEGTWAFQEESQTKDRGASGTVLAQLPSGGSGRLFQT